MAQRKIYTHAIIQKWRDDKISLPQEMAELQKQITSIENEIEKLGKLIHKIKQNNIAPRQVEIHKIEARVRTIDLPQSIDGFKCIQADLENQKAVQEKLIADLEQKIQQQNSSVAKLNDCIALEILRTEKKIALERQIAEKEQDLILLQKKFTHLENTAAHLQSQVTASGASVANLNDQKRKSNEFKGFHQSQTSIFETELDGSLALQKNILTTSQTDLKNAQQQLKAIDTEYSKNHAAISQLKEKLSLLQVQIAGHPAQVFQSTATLAELNAQLSQVNAERLLLQQQLLKAQSTYKQLDEKILTQSVQILTNQTILDQSQDLAKDFLHENNVNKLIEAKNAVCKALTSIQSTIDAHQDKIAGHEKQIQALQRRIAENNIVLETLLTDEFLSSYERNPHLLFNHFSQLLQTKIAAFEEDYPDHQTIDERLALFDILSKLDLFRSENNADPRVGQQQLQQFFGFIACIRTRLIEPTPLLAYLDEVLKSLPLDRAEAFDEYDTLQQVSPNFSLKNYVDLAKKERQDYDRASAEFSQTLNQLPVNSHTCFVSLKKRGLALLQIVQDSKENLGNHFNLKFNTSLLTAANQLALPAADATARQRFSKLISKVNAGKPSLSKKITGAAIFFLGAAILVASVSVKILSLAVASPLTILGMCVGVKTMLGGIGLFASGMERGMSRALTKYYKSSCNRVNQDEIDGVFAPKFKME